jgi:hypothetical protein
MVAVGTPEEVAKIPSSYTGEYLKRVLTDSRAHIAISSEHDAVAEYQRVNDELLKSLEGAEAG